MTKCLIKIYTCNVERQISYKDKKKPENAKNLPLKKNPVQVPESPFLKNLTLLGKKSLQYK